MTVLVTGATGLVGNNVVRQLLNEGHSVRVLIRSACDPRPLAGLSVEVVQGDVRDSNAVRDACRGAEAVIHAAAMIHLGWRQLEPAREINVGGTRNVVAAAHEAGARLVHVSSVDTLGLGTPETPADEDTPPIGQVPCTYVVTKREAEAVVREAIGRGLDAVIVHPGFMLGPWDWKPSSGRMLLTVARKFTPLAPTGGYSLCDVRDVTDGILAAWRRGTCGRNFILGGHNMRYADAWRLFAEVGQGAGPWFCAGPLMRVLGGRGGDLIAKITGREPDVNSAAVAMSSQYHYYHSDRAERELGYHIRPARETVVDAWQWFREHGYV
ncbi:MAG: NAD-dependent epimerase/dehydratase family protein [Pirellulaceae bacterium]|nr:NAD-dependent epimerase/dehydratase family protein [Pirellulaceae bacterium]